MATGRTPYARTFQQIIDDTLRLCGDFVTSGGDGRRYAWSEVADAVNDTVFLICRELGFLKTWGVIQLVAGSAVYNFPPDCDHPMRMVYRGNRGFVILPASIDSIDIYGGYLRATGTVSNFFRRYLSYNQFAVIPVPNVSGDTWTANPSALGVPRYIQGADGGMMQQAGGPPGIMRYAGGMPITRTGNGTVLRGLQPTHNNIEINYLRTPQIMVNAGDYPDPDIPDYLHKDIKFRVATQILSYRKDKFSKMKAQVFNTKWINQAEIARRFIEQESTTFQYSITAM